MSTVKKLAVFVVMVSVAIAAERAWLNAVQPQIATQVAIRQLEGNNNAFRQLRLFETYKGIADVVVASAQAGLSGGSAQALQASY